MNSVVLWRRPDGLQGTLLCISRLTFWYRERGVSFIGDVGNSLSWIAFHVQLVYRYTNCTFLAICFENRVYIYIVSKSHLE